MEYLFSKVEDWCSMQFLAESNNKHWKLKFQSQIWPYHARIMQTVVYGMKYQFYIITIAFFLT
jgi:hypothetical protein